jgi:hypothetical protein
MGHQHANVPHTLALLRTRRERPSNRRTNNRFDKIASSHSRP